MVNKDTTEDTQNNVVITMAKTKWDSRMKAWEPMGQGVVDTRKSKRQECLLHATNVVEIATAVAPKIL